MLMIGTNILSPAGGVALSGPKVATNGSPLHAGSDPRQQEAPGVAAGGYS